MYVITAERAEACLRAQALAEPELPFGQAAPAAPDLGVREAPGAFGVAPAIASAPVPQPDQLDQLGAPCGRSGRPTAATTLTWSGDIPAQKWVNFDMKVLTKIAIGSNLQLSLRVTASGDQGFSQQRADEMRAALRELGLDPSITIE